MGFELPEREVSISSSLRSTPSAASTTPSIVVSHHPLSTTYTPALEVQPHGNNRVISEETARLQRAIVQSIEDFLRTGYSVVIDRCGILTPTRSAAEHGYSIDGVHLRRWEERLSVSFEKSHEITAFHRERFPRLIDTKDLVRATHLALPCEDGLRASERTTRRRIVDLFRTLREELIERGFSAILAPIGELYALHNRQGETASDRFAGADIFLVPRFMRRLRLGETRRFERPILETGGEIFEAAYGAPIKRLRIDLPKELRALGYSLSAEEETQFLGEKLIDVGVFATGEREGKPILIYVTEGIRRLGLNKGGFGTELTFQLPVSSTGDSTGGFTVPEWPIRALTLGWLLVLSSRTRAIEPGVGFTAEVPLIPDCDTELCAVFTTPFRPIRTPQIDTVGEFSFINIVGITSGEAGVAQRFGGNHLSNLLRHRGLDQATRPTRPSVLGRGYLAPESTPQS